MAKTYSLLHGAAPHNWALAFEPCLYYQNPHLALMPQPLQCFGWQQHGRGVVALLLVVAPKGQVAQSLPFRPFGGIQAMPGIAPEQLAAFLTQVQAQLQQQGSTGLALRLPPPFYATGHAAWTEAIAQAQGFACTQALINHHIPITQQPFTAGLAPMEARRLQKGQAANLQVVPTEGPLNAQAVYQFIAQCRHEKNRPVSMDWPTFEATLEAVPHSFKLYSVMHQGQRVAATAMIKVSPAVWYNFLPASAGAASALSPMVFLLNHLYQQAQQAGASVLDLGVSVENNVPHWSLASFKAHVGGQPTIKRTLQKIW